MARWLALAQDEIAEAERGMGGPIPLWWLWLIVAVAFIALIVWLLRRMGGPSGPWFR